MAPRILIITPTYNERDNLAEFVSSVLATVPDAHVLVVDDASPDGTGALGDELAARDGRVQVLHRPAKLGLGTAYLEGFRRALDGGYDVAFEMDADLSHDPGHLPVFLDAIARGADVVLGSRNVPGGGVEGWGLGRHALSKGGSLYARTLLGVGVRDLTTGYKAFTRRALLSLDHHPGRRRPRPHDRLQGVHAARAPLARSRQRALERLRVPDRDDLPGAPQRAPRGRGADRVRRPPRRPLEDEPEDLRRGDRRGLPPEARRRARAHLTAARAWSASATGAQRLPVRDGLDAALGRARSPASRSSSSSSCASSRSTSWMRDRPGASWSSTRTRAAAP
jgi:dolichol-phosphate mannosyltransferase